MDGIEYGRKMTDAEALMWRLESDPHLSSTFAALTVLDTLPDVDALRRRLERAAAVMPRLRQIVRPVPGNLAPPTWVDDPEFDIDHHVRHIALGGRGNERALLDLATLITVDPFDLSRPLWQFTVIEGLPDGRAAVVQKLHHTIADGESGVRLALEYLDFERHPKPAPTQPAPAHSAPAHSDDTVSDDDAAAEVVRDILASTLRLPLGVVQHVRELLADPSHIPEATALASETFANLAAQVGRTDPALSPLWRTRSVDRHFEVTSAPLAAVKAAASELGGTLNHAFLTIATEAASRYHSALGAAVDELRASMAISTRTSESGANAFSLIRLLVPTGDMGIDERFRLVRIRAVDALASTKSADVETLAAFASNLPTGILTRLARQQAQTVDFATSNVKGSPLELYLAGAHVLCTHAIGPLAGVAFNATLLSYVDRLDMGLNINRGAIDEPELLTRSINDAVAGLVAFAG